MKRLAIGRAPEVVISFLFTRTILKLLLLRRGEEIFSGEMCGSLGDVVLDSFRSGSHGFARIRSDSPGFARIRSDALGAKGFVPRWVLARRANALGAKGVVAHGDRLRRADAIGAESFVALCDRWRRAYALGAQGFVAL